VISTRIISAIIGLLLLFVIFLSDIIFINIGVAIVSIIALFELLNTLHYKKNIPLVAAALAGGIIFIIFPFVSSKFALPILYVYIIVLFVMLLKYHHAISLNDITIIFFMIIYTCFFLSHITFTRMMENGKILVWLIFIGAWVTDTCAFFVGISIGRHKLVPQISPKKTIEGSIGGIIGCVLAFILFGMGVNHFGTYHVNYVNLVILGLLCSVFGQIGDLFASVIKRQYGVKDFGSIMPGHGGILDRFDSVILVAPLVYYYLMLFDVII